MDENWCKLEIEIDSTFDGCFVAEQSSMKILM